MSQQIAELASELRGGVVAPEAFRLEKILGRGGFGEVWKAVHIPTGTVCAYKKLFMDQMSADDAELFIREVKILAQCRHPFLLHLLGFTACAPYAIITPFISNGSLYDYVCKGSKRQPLQPTNKTLIAMGIAYAMMRLHEQGIIHRDLKSPNVLLDDKFLPYVCDFGIARHNDENGMMTKDCGTSCFMAPEQMGSHHYDGKVDVYSYAMVLYEMIENCIPFDGLTTYQIAVEVIEHGARPKFSHHHHNKAINDLINSCWQQSPEDRPSFRDIFLLFAKKKVMWDDSNPMGIDAMLSLTGSLDPTLAELLRSPTSSPSSAASNNSSSGKQHHSHSHKHHTD